MNRFLSFSLTFILILLSGENLFSQKFNCNYHGVSFQGKIEGNAACITSFDLKAERVEIPSQIIYKDRIYPVTKVSTFLNGVNYLTVSLVLESGIQEIDKFCFNEFRKLKSLSLPASIVKVGKNAIRMNDGLDIQCEDPNFDLASLVSGKEIVRFETTNWPSAILAMNEALSEASQLAETSKNKKRAVNKAEASHTNKRNNEAVVHRQEQSLNTSVDKKFGKNAVDRSEVKMEKADAKHIINADVDNNIPVCRGVNENTFCVIIANESYRDVPEVQYACHDGETFKEYCIKTLGIPERQIRLFSNASFTDMKRALNWMDNMAKVSGEGAKMIFYYAGHGIPNETDNSAYLIPVDGFPKDVSTCFKLSDLYARLGELPVDNVTVFLDACFSGVRRGDGAALIAARGVAIKAKKEALSGNLVVFSAASDDETAFAYEEKGHGMFTYFLLKKLQESEGNVSLGELSKYISSNVMRNSMLENDKLQSPTVSTSAVLKGKWENIHL